MVLNSPSHLFKHNKLKFLINISDLLLEILRFTSAGVSRLSFADRNHHRSRAFFGNLISLQFPVS